MRLPCGMYNCFHFKLQPGQGGQGRRRANPLCAGKWPFRLEHALQQSTSPAKQPLAGGNFHYQRLTQIRAQANPRDLGAELQGLPAQRHQVIGQIIGRVIGQVINQVCCFRRRGRQRLQCNPVHGCDPVGHQTHLQATVPRAQDAPAMPTFAPAAGRVASEC